MSSYTHGSKTNYDTKPTSPTAPTDLRPHNPSEAAEPPINRSHTCANQSQSAPPHDTAAEVRELQHANLLVERSIVLARTSMQRGEAVIFEEPADCDNPHSDDSKCRAV